MEKKITKSGTKGFFRKYMYYILIALALIAAGTIVTLSLTIWKDDVEPVDNTPQEMIMPVSAEYTIVKEFANDQLLWSATLKMFKTHEAIDIACDRGTNVCAVLDGTVDSVMNTDLEGTVVVIKHADNLKTLYKSLDKTVPVTVGAKVKQGDVIGKVSDTMITEITEGPHLHFEVMEAGAYVDPAKYIESLK